MSDTNKHLIGLLVRQASDKIWNQNGKHTHAELDEIIRAALSTYGDQRERDTKEKIGKWLLEFGLNEYFISNFNAAFPLE